MNNCPKIILFKEGDTWARRIIFSQEGIPLNLNFTEAFMQIRDISSNEIVAEASTRDGSIVIYPDIGAMDIYFEKTFTYTVEPGIYKTNLKVVYLDGTIQSSPLMLVEIEEGVTMYGEGKRPKDYKHPYSNIVPLAAQASLKDLIVAKKGKQRA